uniref:trithorax group protein osa isoform X2 n=1 Tax=Doryrhamphus excisus TaxID=161450 RepID=UPI0025ADC7EC|nr:trithorax group protein osa isoform X2 [Doryrhamphus excisus]
MSLKTPNVDPRQLILLLDVQRCPQGVLTGDMRQLVSFFISLALTALVQAQDQVQIQFQTDPVLVLTGTEIQFTVLTIPDVLSVTWRYEGVILGLWVGGTSTINAVPQFSGRVTITATQLRIGGAQLADAGDYAVDVVPVASTGLTENSRSVLLRVFAPAPYTWQRDGEAVVPAQPDSGVLDVQTSSTDDGGRFTCTARNEVTGGTSEQATDVSVENTCLDVGEVVGIVIGSFLLLLILVLLLVLLACLLLRRRARQRRAMEAAAVQKNHAHPRPSPPDVPADGPRGPDRGPDPPVFQSSSQARRPQVRADGDLNGMQTANARGASSYPHDGVDNPAFTRHDPHPPNPNILIQTGTAQSGGQPAAVQLSLNALPQGGQQHSRNPQMPTIHLNLNAFPAGSQHAQQDANRTRTYNPYPVGTAPPGGPAHPRPAGRSQETGFTSTTMAPSTHTAQRNANTQTYQQEAELHGSPTHRQMPWDRLRGTPAYPRRTLPRPQSPDSTDYTSHPPLQQTPPRGGNPFREDAPPTGVQLTRTRSRSVDAWNTRALRVPQLEPDNHSHRSPPTQRERARQDLRAPPVSQEGTPSTNPFVRPQGADTRAMADPNHLLQPGVAVVQTHQGPSAGTHGAGQPGRATSSSTPNQNPAQPSALTQAALKVHTERAQTFQNRRQQTQAALLRPGTQTRGPTAPGGPHPPTPPPVIPLSRFQSLPRTRHRSSPTRGPQQQPQRRPQHRPGHHHHHHGNVPVHGHAHPRQAHRGPPR